MTLLIDLFAGAGGASLGIEAAAGRSPDYAINHDPHMVRMHQVNHPDTEHLVSDVWEVEPAAVTKGRRVAGLWASPDCKHFSKAKGGRPVNRRVRSLAWVVVKWAVQARPDVIWLENVEEFATWGPLGADDRPCRVRKGETFRRWIEQLRRLGYAVDWRELVAADFGAPTTRKRLFVVARCDGLPIRWPEPTHAPRHIAAERGLLPWRPAAECIDFTLPCPSIFERKRPLAEATLRRVAHGVMRYVVNSPDPFVITIDHQGSVGNVARSSDDPISTITSKQRHALVTAWIAKHYGGVVGHGPERPLGTITATDHHSLVVSHLSNFYSSNTRGGGGDPRDPLRTITGGGLHAAEVRAFLTAYYGNERDGRDARDPLGTITTRDRFGLVQVAGVEYQIVDVGLRMLTPRELLRAQFGRHAEGYTLIGTQAQQVRGIGNSVCPEVAEAVVAANPPGACARQETVA